MSSFVLCGNQGYNIAYETGFSDVFRLQTPRECPLYFTSYNFNNINSISNDFNEFTFIESGKCQFCGVVSNKLVQRNLDFTSCCISCLNNVIKSSIKLRKSFILKEKAFNYEYYSRSIQITNTSFISNNECLKIFNKSILYLIKEYVSVTCVKCNSNMDKPLKLKCGCLYCSKCASKLLSDATEEKIILTDFEKSNFII